MSAALTAGLLIIGIGAVPQSAYAQAAEFRRHLNAAIRLYESLEYERALKQRLIAETARDFATRSLAPGRRSVTAPASIRSSMSPRSPRSGCWR